MAAVCHMTTLVLPECMTPLVLGPSKLQYAADIKSTVNFGLSDHKSKGKNCQIELKSRDICSDQERTI